jgi:hypothetical protein
MSNQVAKKQRKPRLIQGLLLKCVDGKWTDSDGLTPPGELLVLGTTRGLQCWRDKALLDEIVQVPGEELPDVDELNAKIPCEEWGLGLDGEPREPWALNFVVYLLDTNTGTPYTYLNSTSGAKIAVERLESKFEWIRALRGETHAPTVRLASRPFKTGYGMKQRPEFEISEWREYDVRIGLSPAPTKQIESKPVNDNQKLASSEGKKTDISKPGKPAKPVSGKEATDDEIPF